jgi:hypothetical protein
MGWRKGPLPPGTWDWGGVVPHGEDMGRGFYFADFHGDHVKLVRDGRRLEPHEIKWWNNALSLPPGE